MESYNIEIKTPAAVGEVYSIISQTGGTAYLVGGLVRDAFIRQFHSLTHDNKDFDLEVFGVDMDTLEALLTTGIKHPVSIEGKAFQVLKVHYRPGVPPIDVSIPRKEVSTGKGYRDFKITPDPHLSLSAAAERRDLTCNTLYYDPENKIVYDPLGGVKDIENKVIRMANPKTFVEDPLRLFRVMELAARFGFKITDKTVEAAKAIVKEGMTHTLSIERVREEFIKLSLRAIRPSIGFDFLKDTGALEIYFSELAELEKVDQTPRWHPEGNVWNHTMQVVNAASDIAKRESLSPYEKSVLFFACLCHDVGKAISTRYDKEADVYRAHGHSGAGVSISKDFFRNLGMPNFLCKQIPYLVEYHMRIPVLYENHVKLRQDQTKAFSRLFLNLKNHKIDIRMLLWLVEADRRGRNGNESSITAREPLKKEELKEFPQIERWFYKTLKNVEEKGERKDYVVGGQRVLEVVGKPSGVWVGGVKEVMQDLVFDSKFRKKYTDPHVFDGEGFVREELIKKVYVFLLKEVGEGNFDWKNLIEDEKLRDKVVGELVEDDI